MIQPFVRQLFIVVAFLCPVFLSLGKSIKILPSQTMLYPGMMKNQAIEPGDTLLLQTGIWHHLLLKNIHGTEEKPIIIMNDGGLVRVESDHYYGISLTNCRFIRLTGSGDSNWEYGIRISQVKGGAIGGNGGTTDLEIDHIEIDSVKGVGIMVKTDATCDQFQRHQFTQRNTHIHHNKITNVGLEGLYVGSSNYPGRKIKCNGKTVVVLDPILDGVFVHNNIVESPGWDAIQVSSAINLDIHHNHVYHDSKALHPNQMSAIQVGGGSEGVVRNNMIKKGNGNGINYFGLGNFRIFNNIIIDPGQWVLNKAGKFGIYINDKLDKDANVKNYLYNNLIVNPSCEAIHLEASNWAVNSTIIANNILINPGCYHKYAPFNKAELAYISWTKEKAVLKNNFTSLNIGDAKLDLDNAIKRYVPYFNSPLVNQGYEVAMNIILYDFYDYPRVSGSKIDIGPVEYSGPNRVTSNMDENRHIIVSPVQNHELKIKLRKETASTYQLKVYSVSGELVFFKDRFETCNDTFRKIQLPKMLKKGMYLIVLESKEDVNNYQIVVL